MTKSIGSNSELTDLAVLLVAVDELLARGDISPTQAAQLRLALPEQHEQSRYVLRHFAAHMSIGVIFAFDIVPLPLGTIARVLWVAGARIIETLRGNLQLAAVHSLPVFLVAAIPWLGYIAYLLPLRSHHRDLAFVLANAAWLKRRELSYEHFVDQRGGALARLARWVVPLPWNS